MFSTEIIVKIIEIILNFGKDIISRSQDSKRQFARQLLAFYDAVKDYKAECECLLRVLDEDRQRNPNRGISDYAAS